MTPCDDADNDTDPDAIKARIHRLMAEHAAILPRGYNTTRERNALHQRIDHDLDRWALATTNSDDIPVA